MSKGKDAAALVVAAVAMMMFFTGCETTKHAEVMSAEDLARQQAVLAGAKSSGAEQGGVPLVDQGLSEGSIAMEGGGAEPSGLAMSSGSDLSPQGPPLPTLRDGSSTIGRDAGKSTIADTRDSGVGMVDRVIPTTPSGSKDPVVVESSTGGPSGYEGQQFVQGLTPSDFVPEGPPQPNLGHTPFTSDLKTGPRATADAGAGASGTATSPAEVVQKSDHDEVVQMPDHNGASDSMEPLSQSDVGGSHVDVSPGDGSEIDHVYFDFDKYDIRADAVSTLRKNAELLTGKYKFSSVLIEGHCDERGTRDYNLVLGERRAQAVKNYLVDLGVSSSRVRIVSYGKERPFCSASEESCWQKNRRGHIVLQ
jgi:peptidoglycan-associated lipoprotein